MFNKVSHRLATPPAINPIWKICKAIWKARLRKSAKMALVNLIVAFNQVCFRDKWRSFAKRYGDQILWIQFYKVGIFIT